MGEREQVVEKLLLGVGPEVDVLEVFLRQRRQHGDEIVDAAEREAEGAAGEMRVAAALFERRGFEHQHARAVLVRRDRGAQGGIAGPDHEDIRRFARAVRRNSWFPRARLRSRLRAQGHELDSADVIAVVQRTVPIRSRSFRTAAHDKAPVPNARIGFMIAHHVSANVRMLHRHPRGGHIAAERARTPAAAQAYPTRPVTIVVPFAAGGGNDIMARLIAQHMGRALGQQFVIENRAGAGGTMGARAVAKAAPDGYTLMVGHSGVFGVAPALYADPGYEPRRDFAPIGLIASYQQVLVVHPSVPVHSVADLIALARKEPGKITYATAGVGSGSHLSTELFAVMADIKLTHIPYRGTGAMQGDLVGGHVDMSITTFPSVFGQLRSGGLRPVAVTGETRSPIYPDLPTIAEAGVPGYAAVIHYGMVAPAGISRAIAERLNAELRAALAQRGRARAHRRRGRRAAARHAATSRPPTSPRKRRSGARWCASWGYGRSEDFHAVIPGRCESTEPADEIVFTPARSSLSRRRKGGRAPRRRGG